MDTSDCVSICLLNIDVVVNGNSIESIEDSPNVSYQWIDCASGETIEGQVEPIFEPTINGEYALILDDGVCSLTSECVTMCPTNINTEVTTFSNSIQALADTLTSNYQWINCSDGSSVLGQTGSTFTPSLSGDYAVVIDQGNCIDTSECVTICLIDSGISQIGNTIQALADTLTSTFQWINCSDGASVLGQTESTFTPSLSGEYAVVINQGNCVDTSECVSICLLDSNVSVMGNTIYSLADTLTSTFQWIDCSDESSIVGQTGSTFTPSVSGEYAVVINQGNCIDTSECVKALLHED